MFTYFQMARANPFMGLSAIAARAADQDEEPVSVTVDRFMEPYVVPQRAVEHMPVHICDWIDGFGTAPCTVCMGGTLQQPTATCLRR